MYVCIYRADHFANECRNVVCFNCDELGHQAKECGGPVLCCICKSPEHRARRCPFAWHQSSSSLNCDPSTGGHVAAPAGDFSSHDPASGGDVTAPAILLVHKALLRSRWLPLNSLLGCLLIRLLIPLVLLMSLPLTRPMFSLFRLMFPLTCPMFQLICLMSPLARPMLPRRKPAPMPAALEALTRRPTRPTLPVSGRSSTSTPPPDEMFLVQCPWAPGRCCSFIFLPFFGRNLFLEKRFRG